MNSISTRKFYGTPKPVPIKSSLALVAQSLQTKIFKALRFPLKQKAKCTIRIPILHQDISYFSGKTLDSILRYGFSYTPEWHSRGVTAAGDINDVVPEECVVKVRKMRKEKAFIGGGSGQTREKDIYHGSELVVTLWRRRRPARPVA